MQVNYSRYSFRINFMPHYNQQIQQLTVGIETGNELADVYFTSDGSEPDNHSYHYDSPIPIDKTTVLKAVAFINGIRMEKVYTKELNMHKAVGAEVQYKIPYSKKYTAGGDLGLVDGISSPPTLNSEIWQGFEGTDLDLVIELREEMEISKISAGFLHRPSSWIYRPEKVSFSVSMDGEDFQLVDEAVSQISKRSDEEEKEVYDQKFLATKTRFIRIHAEGVKRNPSWHSYPGYPCWIFADEIVIE